MVGNLCVFSQGFSFGALDLIAGAPESAPSVGALDVISDCRVEENPLAVGALNFIASAVGQVSPGALNYISRFTSQGNYYKSGSWNIDVVGMHTDLSGNRGLWMGQMLEVPQWGKITSTFGFRPSFGRMHKGIDIAMSVGDTVRCPLPGVVDRVNYEAGGYGHYIVVRHDNGLETRYAHLSSTMVVPGERINPESPIALSGNTGNSTGPHLHFETRINGIAVDPQSIFNFAGGRVMARRNSYARDSFTGTPGAALDHITANGSRGRSLNEKRTYVVKAGDTLEKIAGLAGTSVFQLCQLNFISATDPLVPGTMIRLQR